MHHVVDLIDTLVAKVANPGYQSYQWHVYTGFFPFETEEVTVQAGDIFATAAQRGSFILVPRICPVTKFTLTKPDYSALLCYSAPYKGDWRSVLQDYAKGKNSPAAIPYPASTPNYLDPTSFTVSDFDIGEKDLPIIELAGMVISNFVNWVSAVNQSAVNQSVIGVLERDGSNILYSQVNNEYKRNSVLDQYTDSKSDIVNAVDTPDIMRLLAQMRKYLATWLANNNTELWEMTHRWLDQGLSLPSAKPVQPSLVISRSWVKRAIRDLRTSAAIIPGIPVWVPTDKQQPHMVEGIPVVMLMRSGELAVGLRVDAVIPRYIMYRDGKSVFQSFCPTELCLAAANHLFDIPKHSVALVDNLFRGLEIVRRAGPEYEWRSQGGYTKTPLTLMARAKDLGFKKHNYSQAGDALVSTCITMHDKHNNTLTTVLSIGQTQDQNFYSVSLRLTQAYAHFAVSSVVNQIFQQ